MVESAVIGLPHPGFRRRRHRCRGAASQGAGARRKNSDNRRLADKLAKYKQPKRVLFVEELPRNTMGKVQKNLLRQGLCLASSRLSAVRCEFPGC